MTIWDVSLPRILFSCLPVIGAGMLGLNYYETFTSDGMYRQVVLKEKVSAEKLIENSIKQTRKVIVYALSAGVSAALSFVLKAHLLVLGLFSLPAFTALTMLQVSFSAIPLALVCFWLSRDPDRMRELFA